MDYKKNSQWPIIYKICNFYSDVLPDVNSIIWAPDSSHNYLKPYRVTRIDYLEDEENNM